MKRLTFGLTAMIVLMVWTSPAHSAINECAAQLCPVVYKNSGHVVFYDLSDQEKGSVTFVSSAQGYVCAKDGLVVVNQLLTDTALLYKVANGSSQVANVGVDTANSTVFNGIAYLGGWSSYIYEADPDTGSVTPVVIGSGYGPWSVASNDSFAFTMNAAVASITEIDVSDTQFGPYSVGVLADQFEGLIWDEDDQVLYATIANNVAEIVPGSPSYTVNDYLATDLAEKPTLIDSDSTHIVVEGQDYIYIISKGTAPVPAGQVTSAYVGSVRDVALCGGYVYAASGSGVEKFDTSGSSLGMLTTDNTWGVACVKPTCGNGDIDIGEECDDSNTTSGDGCSAACQNETAVCGNGNLENGEECDDNGTSPGDGCDANCQVETGYKCDGGSPTTCELACGDGVLDASAPFNEECDDDGTSGGDGCDASCQIESGWECDGASPSSCWLSCGDGDIDTGEACDPGDGGSVPENLNGQTCVGLGYGGGTLFCTAACAFNTTSCTPPVTCGNSQLDNGETCDDGNPDPNDGCGANCQVEPGYKCVGVGPSSCQLACGDGVTDSEAPFNEECDDGLANSDTESDACRTDCTNPTCGDGVTDTGLGEQCDDNNLTAGDGCDENCQIESASCGDGVVDTEENEECDPGNGSDILENLNGESCESQEFSGGQLSCTNYCRLDTSACTNEPVCDPEGKIEHIEAMPDHESFTAASKARHDVAVALFPTVTECTKTCREVGGKTIIRLETTGRCIVRIENERFWVVLELYQLEQGIPAAWDIDPDNPENWARYSGGWVFLHEGESIQFFSGAARLVSGVTLGTGEGGEITGVGTDDEKMVVTMTHKAELFSYMDKEVTLSADGNNQGVFYLNRPLDSPVWNTDIDPPGGCCSASGNSSGMPLLIPMIIILFLWRKRRK